jgi:hypothetical protein
MSYSYFKSCNPRIIPELNTILWFVKYPGIFSIRCLVEGVFIYIYWYNLYIIEVEKMLFLLIFKNLYKYLNQLFCPKSTRKSQIISDCVLHNYNCKPQNVRIILTVSINRTSICHILNYISSTHLMSTVRLSDILSRVQYYATLVAIGLALLAIS